VDLATLSQAVAFRSGMGVLGPVFASIADSRGRKISMLLGLLLFSAGVGLVIFWPVYPVFVAALVLTMLGRFMFDPAMMAYLGDRVPYQGRGRVVAIAETGWSLAFVIGVPIAGFLISRGGWMAPFPLFAGLGLLFFGLTFWIIPRDPPSNKGQPGLWRNVVTLIGNKVTLTGLTFSMLFVAANEVIGLIFGVWLEDSFNLKLAALGAASAVIGLSELTGEGLSAMLVDRLGKQRAIGLGILANCLAIGLLLLVGRTIPGALFSLFLFFMTSEYTLVCSISLMTELAPQSRATLISLNTAAHSVGRAMGAYFAADLYGFGILGSCLVALGINILAFLVLSALKRHLGNAM
jgi:predicted MFS family arabinose efflux permease